MSDVIRRLFSAALLGAYFAVAPSNAPQRWSASSFPPAIVLGIGEPTPSIAVRPRR
ncbi:MAG: hypothetical protein OES13_08740 [Acidimicrobiia bacterium]|nr:hypothetical protein [Acidimicrobiia bacterium]